jgi:hypothetical protein
MERVSQPEGLRPSFMKLKSFGGANTSSPARSSPSATKRASLSLGAPRIQKSSAHAPASPGPCGAQPVSASVPAAMPRSEAGVATVAKSSSAAASGRAAWAASAAFASAV